MTQQLVPPVDGLPPLSSHADSFALGGLTGSEPLSAFGNATAGIETAGFERPVNFSAGGVQNASCQNITSQSHQGASMATRNWSVSGPRLQRNETGSSSSVWSASHTLPPTYQRGSLPLNQSPTPQMYRPAPSAYAQIYSSGLPSTASTGARANAPPVQPFIVQPAGSNQGTLDPLREAYSMISMVPLEQRPYAIHHTNQVFEMTHGISSSAPQRTAPVPQHIQHGQQNDQSQKPMSTVQYIPATASLARNVVVNGRPVNLVHLQAQIQARVQRLLKTQGRLLDGTAPAQVNYQLRKRATLRQMIELRNKIQAQTALQSSGGAEIAPQPVSQMEPQIQQPSSRASTLQIQNPHQTAWRAPAAQMWPTLQQRSPQYQKGSQIQSDIFRRWTLQLQYQMQQNPSQPHLQMAEIQLSLHYKKVFGKH